MKIQFQLLLSGLLMITSIFGISSSALASVHNFCPDQVSGWWGTMTPTGRLCDISYYTWNTNSGVANEESWFTSDPHYQLCNYSSLQNPGNVSSRAYIPSPDFQQTNNGAHYYKWDIADNYTMIGSINQYSVYGWANMYTYDWGQYDVFKLSDWTNDGTEYSKHVDLDAFSVDCYFN